MVDHFILQSASWYVICFASSLIAHIGILDTMHWEKSADASVAVGWSMRLLIRVLVSHTDYIAAALRGRERLVDQRLVTPRQ